MLRARVWMVVLLLLTGCTGGDGAGGSTATPAGPPATRTSASPTPPPDLSRARVRLTRIATLDQPLALAVRRGDPALYIAERTGRVVALREGRRRRMVLDLRGRVTLATEQGLLGLAFAPDGSRLYINFTDSEGDTRIVEYDFDGERARSPRRVLAVDQPYSNHNGGNLVFGPDGMLYIGLGDGGSAGDPEDNAQNPRRLLGKMLRIDPRPSGERPYGIPGDNPFVGRGGARGEVWGLGLRNPWRYSFDRDTGDLWIGDVGQNSWEEIDFTPAGSGGGHNYGWPLREARHRFEGARPERNVDPIHEYALAEGACSVTGGFVYRGRRIPALRGAYVFSDFCIGRITAFVREGTRARTLRRIARAEQVASFGEDADGELYVLSLAGPVYRIDPR